MALATHYHCDQDAICTYRADAVDRLRSDPARCIKHGAILTPCFCLLTTRAVRRALEGTP
jgi:hypothetical protein